MFYCHQGERDGFKRNVLMAFRALVMYDVVLLEPYSWLKIRDTTKKQALDYFNSDSYSSSEFYIPTSAPSCSPEETFVDQYAGFVVYSIC